RLCAGVGHVLAAQGSVPGARALVVDDDDPIRKMLATLVALHGFDVETARDGAEAIERLDEDGFTLVVLDLMMPRVDGYAVLPHIKESQPGLLRCTILASSLPTTDVRRHTSAAAPRAPRRAMRGTTRQRNAANMRKCAMFRARRCARSPIFFAAMASRMSTSAR